MISYGLLNQEEDLGHVDALGELQRQPFPTLFSDFSDKSRESKFKSGQTNVFAFFNEVLELKSFKIRHLGHQLQ